MLQQLREAIHCHFAPRRRSALLVATWLLLMRTPTAFGQGGPPRSLLETLTEEFTDPLTPLPQILLQDAFTPANYGTDAQTNRLIVRAIVPRLPRFSLFPFYQLIRPQFSLVTIPTGKGSSTRTEFGDIDLVDLAILPWPDPMGVLKVGIGPTLVFPTATFRSAGQSSWQAGPAFAAVYFGIPRVLLGCFLQNPISFAYTSSRARPLNFLEFQPIVLFQLGRGWYLKSADSTWSSGWHRHTATMLPLSFGIGRVMLGPRFPPINFYVSGQWLAYRQFAPAAPQTTVNFGITIAIPQLRKW